MSHTDTTAITLPEQVSGFNYDLLNDATRQDVQARTAAIKDRVDRLAIDIIETGQDLIAVKEQLGHGHFMAWVEAEFPWGADTTERFMRVARLFKFRTVRNLPIERTALYLLSDPSFPPAVREAMLDRAEGGEVITTQMVRDERAAYRRPEPVVGAVPFPSRRYRCIVIDPPWHIKKIERDERPAQGATLDYPTMPLDEIAALPLPDLADPDGCHLYLWVTQKYLPAGLELFEHWGFTYQCLMTWVKPTGMTPYSWMYTTEHVIFGRCGSLKLQRNGLKLSFEAPSIRHSAKPDVFYERVLAASPGPRLEMFARTARDGFDVWGNEVNRDGAEL